jgi:hypothetical protein
MHAGCTACEHLTRASAFRWLGVNNPIPALHGTGWLGGDLLQTLSGLGPGEEILLDYRGEVADAPTILVRRSEDDVFTAHGPDDGLKRPEATKWAWQPSDEPHRITSIMHDLLSYIRDHRGAHSVVLVESS